MNLWQRFLGRGELEVLHAHRGQTEEGNWITPTLSYFPGEIEE